jgi:NADH-quinone oxidoreductase subunit L
MQHPGQLYVAATLLPLASFLLLLLAGAIRAAARPFRQGGAGAALYEALGGDRPVRAGAYIATGAISLSFVLSVIGFFLFLGSETHGPGHKASPHAASVTREGHGPVEQEKLVTAEARASDAWAQSITWAALPELAGQPAVALTLGYRIDSLAAIMFLMVTFISSVIHLFSIGYMSEELEPIVEDHQVHTETGHLRRRGRFGRFFLFLSLFCFSMLNLVLADNLFQVFLSWELVGICSYLLIGFYYERRSASNAANKAFITNRVGDAGFIVGLLILWTYVGTFNFQEIFQRVRCPATDSQGEKVLLFADKFVRANLVEPDKLRVTKDSSGSQVVLFLGPLDRQVLDGSAPVLTIAADYQKRHFDAMPYWLLVAAGLGIFLGCVGKSAQFPLHVWLPDAMEGPTPVSALIHAATMVAAGVYLVCRTFPVFTSEALLVIAYTGGITLFVAATIAVVMTDIKKVLAYSTVSQLGYMMLGLGVGGWVAGLFHLLTHACFKALLFLGSGSVIYGCHHEQDMLKMGGLRNKMPVTAYTMLIGLLAIAGIPLFSGWYSKDAILAHAFGFCFVEENRKHFLLILLPLLTAGITAFYMFRMWLLTFGGEPRDERVYEHAHESPWVMTLPLILLAILSFAVAWGWPLYDAEASILDNQIHHSQPASVTADFPEVVKYAQAFHFVVGLVALAIVGVGILFASLLYYSRVLDPAEAKEQFPGVHRFLWNKWYFDELYSAILVRPALAVAGWCRAFDLSVIDRTVDALARFTIRLAKWDGLFDLEIIDGVANLTARVIYACGGWLRTVQTGYIRSYVLFLVLAAVGIFFVLTYLMSLAFAQ